MQHMGSDGKMRFSDGRILTSAADNVLVSRLGSVCMETAKRTDVGDSIDRGLILLKLLEEAGFEVREKQ